MVKKINIEKNSPNYSDAEIVEELLKNRSHKASCFYKEGWKLFVQKEKATNYGIEKRREIYQDSFILLWKKIVKNQLVVEDKRVVYYNHKGIKRMVNDLKEWLMRTVDLKIKEIETSINNVLIDDIINEISSNLSEDIWQARKKEDLLNIVRKCIEDMNEKCRIILTRYYWEKVPMKEIKEEVGFKSARTVSNRKKDCFIELRKKILNQIEFC